MSGIFFNSVALIAVAVNNLSDAGTSLISLIGFVISDKPADEDHPYGHARVEYISCMIISFIILALGITLIKNSVKKIFFPEALTTGILSICVLIISIVIKLWLSFFFKKAGKKINSDTLYAASKDSLNDVLSTSAVLLTTIIAYFTKINLDPYAGVIVTYIIIRSGYDILKKTYNNLLGVMPDKELIQKINDKLYSYNGVFGIHDLIVHTYGPEKYFATVHVEVPADADILMSHDLIDNIERDFLTEFNINLVIHLDPVITNDEETNSLKNEVKKIVQTINKDFSIHDFRMVKGETHSNLIFDIAIPPNCKTNSKELINLISDKLKEKDDRLFAVITIDRNYVKENE